MTDTPAAQAAAPGMPAAPTLPQAVANLITAAGSLPPEIGAVIHAAIADVSLAAHNAIATGEARVASEVQTLKTDAMAFRTPNDDSGSRNDPASPTSRKFGP